MPALPSFKEATLKGLASVAKTYARDLSFVPAGMFDASPMGAARTPKDFTLEVIGFNNRVAAALKGREFKGLTDDERASVNHGQAQALVESSAAAVADALSDLDEEQLADVVETPWGEKVTKAEFARMAEIHMIYHCGQVNYLQSIYGDTVNHWAE